MIYNVRIMSSTRIFCYSPLTKKNFVSILSKNGCYSTSPFSKTVNVIVNDVKPLIGDRRDPIVYPEHSDVVIIGGGVIGSSIAYSLKLRAGEGLSVVVLEKDVTFQKARQYITGSLIQHYSLPENIFLSQYGSEFLRNIKEHLGKDVDIQYRPQNHLVLACEKYAHKLEESSTTLKEYGSKNQLMTPEDIRKRYPWINVEDVKLGCLGSECEGTYNSWSVLNGLVKTTSDLGAKYVESEVVGFEMEQQRDLLMEGVAPGSFQRITRVLYRTPDNEERALKFSVCILAAGTASAEIAKLAHIGVGEGLLKVPLPMKQRECRLCSIEDKDKKIKMLSPQIMDTTGFWMRRNGFENNITCSILPSLSSNDDEILSNEEYIDNIIRPCLTNRVPDLKDAQINVVETEMFDSTTFDDSPIVGPHPYHTNLYIAAGFGRQGYSLAPGIGRAITELIVDSQFTTIDLTRLTFDRLLTNQPLVELNVY